MVEYLASEIISLAYLFSRGSLANQLEPKLVTNPSGAGLTIVPTYRGVVLRYFVSTTVRYCYLFTAHDKWQAF